MPIIRGKHSFDGHFTQLPNTWIRDKRLSYKARGLLAELMSHAPGFEVSRERLARSGQDGDRSIRTAISELEDAGYLERRQSRSERGTLGPAIWITKDPFAPSVPFAPADNAPADNATLKNTEVKNTEIKKDLAQDKLELWFDSFWSNYPRKVGKGSAKKAFAKVVSDGSDPLTVISGAGRLALDPNLPPMQFVPHAATWLNREGWLDDPYPERVLSAEERKQKELEDLAVRKQREAEIRERQQLQDKLEREAFEREKEENPIERCEHNRIKVICEKCSPLHPKS